MAEMITLDDALSPNKPIKGKKVNLWDLDDVVASRQAKYNELNLQAANSIMLGATPENLGAVEQLTTSTASTIAEGIQKTPDRIKIMYGGALMDIAHYRGDAEQMEVGKALIQTAVRNIDMINAENERRSIATEADRETFAYGTGNALASYGSMWFTAGVLGKAGKIAGMSEKGARALGTAGGMANMFNQEVGGEVEEGIQVYREKNPEDQELKNIDREWAHKENLTTLAYGTISSIIEKKMGFGLQRKVFLKPMDIVKRSAVGGLSEYTTENLQGLANMGIDLADNSMDWNKLPSRLKEEFVGNLPALLIGAGGGAMLGVEQRGNTKNAIREMIRDSVPPKDLEAIVDNVYDSAVENLAGVVAAELEVSSELQAKHGSIYDSMVRAVDQTINESGSEFFKNLPEDEKAQYVSDSSKLFADTVLAEAIMRGVPVDEVLQATDIVFQDGGIKFIENIDLLDYVKGERKIPREKIQKDTRESLLPFLKRNGGIREDRGELKARDLTKAYPGLVSNKGRQLDYARELAVQHGYIDNDSDINDFLALIDRELGGQKVYKQGEEQSDRKLTTQESVNELIEALDQAGIDYENMTKDEIRAAMEKAGQSVETQIKNELQERPEGWEEGEEGEWTAQRAFETQETLSDEDFDALWEQSFFQLPDEAYEANGYADTNSDAFKAWFGDSRVVDENGDPLMVFHGGTENIEVFDKDKLSNEGDVGAGFYFTSEESDADINYVGGGPDFDIKITREAERIISDEDLDYDQLDEIKERLIAERSKEPTKIEAYLKMEKPFYIGENQTFITIDDIVGDLGINEDNYDNYDEYEDARNDAEQDAFQTLSYEIDDALGGFLQYEDIEQVRAILFEQLYDGITFESLKAAINELYLENENGDLIGNEVTRAVIEALGYDGIIDSSVSEKFKNMNIEEGTSHYVVFKPEQIKSVYNKGTFEATDPNIYNQGAKGAYNASQRLLKLFKGADFSTLPHELGHYWLDNMFNYVKGGQASEKYMERWGALSGWLNIRPDQTRLTRSQQERFASGYEQYLTKGDLPMPMLKGAFDDYDKWLKKIYNDANSVKYQNGKKQLPIRMSDDAVRFFQSMTTGELPPPVLKPMSIKDLNKKLKGSKPSAPKQKTAAQSFNARLRAMKRGDSAKASEAIETIENPQAKVDLAEVENTETAIGNEAQQNALQALENPAVTEALEPAPIVSPTTEVSDVFNEAESLKDGRIGDSKVYSRELEKNAEQLADEIGFELDYNKARLDEQALRALQFVQKDLEGARKVVDGAPPPDGILDTAIRIAYENEMLKLGNNAEYLRALKIHSSIATLRGQNIAAERLATNNMLHPKYWLDKLLGNRQTKAVNDFFGGELKKYSDTLSKETRNAVKGLIGLDLETQRAFMRDLSDRIKDEYGIADVFFQTPLDEELTQENAGNFVRNFLEETFGTTISPAEADTIIGKADQLFKTFEGTLDANGNPSVESFRTLSEMNKTIESFAPSPLLTVGSSILGRSNMLASVKSPTLNIISNAENFVTEAIARRLSMGTMEMSVDKKAIKEYKDWTWSVYKASGFIPSQMMNITDEITTLGEKRPTTQGKGKVRQVSQVMENIVFKYLMGAPDAVAKDWTFIDTADLMATKIAKSEGLTGDALSQRATEIFKDAILISPQTEAGQNVRMQAIEQAHIATYTNDSFISQWALKGREWLNNLGSGQLRVGDLVMPFVKTPANVAMLGVEYGLGALYTAYKLPEIIKNPTSQQSQRALKAAYRNGLGFLISLLLASLVDPEDYIPEFDNATPKDRDLARAKNAPFNSIKIGDKYISLDYFGPVAVPLVGILNARRAKGPKDMIANYFKGTATQAAKIPGIKEVMYIGDFLDKVSASSTTPEKMIEQIGNSVIDQIRARTIPAFVNDIAKMIDSKERDTSGGFWDKAQASIPGLRNQLPERYNIEGQPQKSENPLNTLFFGSRVKTATEGKIIDEIKRLASNKEQPTLADVTRSGDLKVLDAKTKIKVRQDYAKDYAKSVKGIIETRAYKGKDDEDKKKSLNKVRKKIVKDLKKKYSKEIERGYKESK